MFVLLLSACMSSACVCGCVYVCTCVSMNVYVWVQVAVLVLNHYIDKSCFHLFLLNRKAHIYDYVFIQKNNLNFFFSETLSFSPQVRVSQGITCTSCTQVLFRWSSPWQQLLSLYVFVCGRRLGYDKERWTHRGRERVRKQRTTNGGRAERTYSVCLSSIHWETSKYPTCRSPQSDSKGSVPEKVRIMKERDNI